MLDEKTTDSSFASDDDENPTELSGGDEFEPADFTEAELSQVVVFNTDWTVETITAQTENISLTPNFQRRDAWSVEKKSKFIESLILGLPVPPIILAEQKNSRGKFLVIDGKQRLLSILQFWEKLPKSPNNCFALKSLDVRDDLSGVSFAKISKDSNLSGDFSALRNQPVRTVVIRNWPRDEYLHLVFLRLNTGSVRLSAQELRQALMPGDYTNRVDIFASEDIELRKMLGLKTADPRMRDTEILGRHIAFINFLPDYTGRLKPFVDRSFESLNKNWTKWEQKIESQFLNFDHALGTLAQLFGNRSVARQPGSRLLNKALLDPLLYYFDLSEVRSSALANAADLKQEYFKLLTSKDFQKSVSLDTASTSGTVFRFAAIGTMLNAVCGLKLETPKQAKSGIVLS